MPSAPATETTPPEAPAILVAKELPTPDGLPDIEPYLTDILMEVDEKTGPRYKRGMTLEARKAYLQACPWVPVFVAPDTLEQIQNPGAGWTIPVTWKQVMMRVPIGKSALVPLPMARILEERAEPLRTAQAKSRAMYVTEITSADQPGPFGMSGPEIKMS